MNNVWLMKTYQKWSWMFIQDQFVAIDEPGVDEPYGNLTKSQRVRLFEELKEANPKRRWGQMKRFFDDFYDGIGKGDLLVIGTGQTTKFFITAVVEFADSPAYFSGEEARHRRNVKIIWQGEPVAMDKWGWANRLEKLETPERLKEFISAYINLER